MKPACDLAFPHLGVNGARRRRTGMTILLVFAGALWVTAVFGGSFLMLAHSQKPGVADAAPFHWPVVSRLPLTQGKSNLVLFLHPKCPCSRATLSELERLLARSHGALTATVCFIRPAGRPESWVRSDLWHSAEAIPGVTVYCDDVGGEARLFRAQTSGQALLYDAGGTLLFEGGITPSRGHAGDNAGSSAIRALLAGQQAGPVKTKVFGCVLMEADSTSGGGGAE